MWRVFINRCQRMSWCFVYISSLNFEDLFREALFLLFLGGVQEISPKSFQMSDID
jgi:hypothetical protein